MDHPELTHRHHQRQSDRPTVLLCVVAVIIQKVRGREAEGNKVGDVTGGEFSAGFEVRVVLKDRFYVCYGLCYGDGREEGCGVVRDHFLIRA